MFHPSAVTYLCRGNKNFYVEQKRQKKESHIYHFFLMHREISLLMCEQNIFGELTNSVARL